eukprot:m.441020 g.441020  ORF g.441020 m.441020 type:complete len:98 (+) comp18605_c0_seq1:143-436(+)
MGKKKGKSKKSGKKKGGSAAGPAQPLKVCKLCVQPYIALKDPERTLCHLCFMFEMNKPKFEDPTPPEVVDNVATKKKSGKGGSKKGSKKKKGKKAKK